MNVWVEAPELPAIPLAPVDVPPLAFRPPVAVEPPVPCAPPTADAGAFRPPEAAQADSKTTAVVTRANPFMRLVLIVTDI